MMKINLKKKTLYGIKKRMLLFVLPLVLLPLIIANFVSYFVLNNYIESIIIQQLESSNIEIYKSYQYFMNEIDENTKRMITNKSFQDALEQNPLQQETKMAIHKYILMFIYNNTKAIVYMDNKDNIMHTTTQYLINAEDVLGNLAVKDIEGTYGEMKISIAPDNIFNEQKDYLFVSRHVRHLELNIKPGILVLKIDPKAFVEIFKEDLLIENSHYMLVDDNGIIIYHNNDDTLIGKHYYKTQYEKDNDDFILTTYTENKTNWSVVSYVSHKDVFKLYRRYQYIMYFIVFITAIMATMWVLYISKRFTKPIEDLTHAMMDFDNGYFNTRLHPRAHNEIDDASYSFNHMADEIHELIENLENKQIELRQSELKTLVHQINPHFIYNTLDNINMLLRIKGDKTTSELIQSLSKFLRLSLSKGHMYISLKDEFEHGNYYLKIQSVRYSNLFSYTIEIEDGIEDYNINKFIVQPILENSIEHGFVDRYENGEIGIKGYVKDNCLCVSITDNGVGIDEDTLRLLNSIYDMTIQKIEALYPGSSGGYGIANVVSRLRLSYGDKCLLKYSSDSNVTICTISIELSAIIN